MTFQPVLPLLVLAAVAAAIVAGRVVALRRLTLAGRTRTALLRWWGMTLAVLLLLLAAGRPVIGSDDQGAIRAAGDGEPNVFIVVDRSADMRVADLPGRRERMAGARDDVSALIDRYPDARFAVIAFASRPSLGWPLSADTWSLRPVVAALNPTAGTPDGLTQVNVGAANTVLRYQLIGAAAQYPSAPNLVFYLGAGAPESAGPAKEFDLPAGSVTGGAVLGYGTDTGSLPTVAKQIGVAFVPRTDSAPLANPLSDDSYSGSAARPVASAGGIELYWLPALGAAVLVLIELYLTLRDFRRSRLTGLDVPR
jgi:Ca-activated chloride channel family protein